MKRAKLDGADVTASASTLVKDGAYNDIDGFYKDVKKAIEAVEALPEGNRPDINSVTRFETELDEIIQYELGNSSFPIPRAAEQDRAVIVKTEPTISLSNDPDLVLTTNALVHGSNIPAKRVYSSLRLNASALKRGKDILASLALDRLPHGITAASIRAEKGSVGSKVPTLSEVYPTSRHLRSLELPRPSSQAATRGQTISWSQGEPKPKPITPRPGGRTSFYNQYLSNGQWISYNSSPIGISPVSTNEKRKQRDRALSTGEANAELTREEREEIRQEKEIHQKASSEALFKKCYSSFAPTHDNTAAVLPQQLKSRIWWDKFGSAKPIRYLMDEEDIDQEELWKPIEDLPREQDSTFEQMVNTWEDIDTTPADIKKELTVGTEMEVDGVNKDSDEILQEISGMLETLSSYQRNRNLSLNAKQQQGSTAQTKSIVELTGDPATPSNPEGMLYETLKSQLTLIISTLPPYAVAKLDGEKLGDLNISTKVTAEASVSKGTLSFPDPPNPAHSVNASATPTARSHVAAGSRAPNYSSMPTTNRPGLPANRTSSSSSFTSSSLRQAQNATNYATKQLQQQPLQQKVSYSQYGQQTPLTAASQVTNGTRPLTNGYSAQALTGAVNSPTATRTPSLQQRPAQGSQPSTQRPSTAQQQQTYSTYNINMHRGNSPTSAVSNFLNHQRNSLTTASQTPARPWFPNNGTTIGSMFSAEEVQTLENRQKAQMAAQHAQLRQGSGTPQPGRPSSVHSSNGAQSNGIAAGSPQPNGEVAES